MKSKFAALLALTALSLSACGPAVHHEPKAKHAKTKLVTKKIYHFQDGRAGYQADDGMWYYFIADASNQQARNTATTPSTSGLTRGSGNITIPQSGATSGQSSPSGSVSAPAAVAPSDRGGFGSSAQTFGATGGQWVRGEAPKEAEIAEAEVTEETVAESPEGAPETAEQAEATDAAAEAADAADAAADASEGGSSESGSTDSGSTDSGSSDSGSSDAGGGGDSGGGGDGGGGGGE